MFAKRSWWKGAALGAGLLAGVATSSALAASNVVPPSRLSDTLYPKVVSQFVPPECSSYLTIETIIVGTTGGGANELILGSAAAETIRAGNGDDCVLGGDGDDTIRGEGANDILFGGPGNDFLQGDGNTDACIGGPGIDTFHSSCEYQFQ
jgi:Ca2+-binding RTX toxin-like protein